MLTSLRRLSLVLVIVGSLAVFGYLVYTGMGAKTKASISSDVAGNGEIPSSKEGLVAQWNFNETNGDIARSEGSCGKQCDGQLVNFAYTGSQDAALGTGWTAENKLWSTGSLMFDGVNDLVKVNGTKDLDINGVGSKLTIELWFKPNSLSNEWQNLVFKGSSDTEDCHEKDCSNRQYTLWLHKDGFIHFTSSPQGLSYQHSTNTPPGIIKIGEWHHVAATIDSTTGQMQTYVNGKLQVSVSDYSKAGIRSAGGSLSIGNRPAGDVAFNGTIDAVRIYSRALSEKEIAANFAAMSGVNVRCGDAQCDPGYICHQPPQPVCPEGVNCSTVLPRPECINPSIFKEKLCGKEVCKAGYECYQPPRQPDIPCEIGKPCPVADQLPPSCRPITTPTPIFTPQTSITISDNFEGASLDTNKWNTWKNPSGTQAVSMNQEGGVVRIKINPNQTVYSDAVIERKEVITGDFEASVDLKIEQTEGKNTADTFLYFHSVPWGNIIVLGLRRDATNTRIIANQYFNNNWKTELNNPIQSTEKVTVILKKVKNSIIYNYRLNNGEIKTLGTQDAAFNSNGSFLLIGNSWDQFPGVTMTFDNFSAKVNLVSALPTATPIPQSLTATPIPSGTPNASGLLFKVRMPDVAQSVGTVKDVRVLITDKPGTFYDFKIDLQRVQGTDFFIANPIELDIPDGSYMVSIKHAKTLSRTFTVRLSKGKTLDCSRKDADTSCESLGRPELAPLFSGDSDGLVDTKTNNGVRANSYNVIDSADLQRVVSGYGASSLPPEPNGDLNLDGKIDVLDLGILGKNFGKKGD